VALSFPGERRDYVEEVATALKRRLQRGLVFYDKDFTAELARLDLDTLLQKIYRKNSDLVVVFLSEEYERKKWCGLEWRAIKEIIMDRKNRPHTIMLMRFDNTPIEGIFDYDGFIDLNEYGPSEVANFIIRRVQANKCERAEPAVPRSVRPLWPEGIGAYIAESSEMIPYFPEVLSGYRSENNRDFWGNEYACRGTIRLFDGNGWEGLFDFPNTMNGCSAGMFMIRWRSSNPDIFIATTLGYTPDIPEGKTGTGSFGYMYGHNCLQPLFKIANNLNLNGSTLVDVYYELKFWQAAP
jgi:hypothetical protein